MIGDRVFSTFCKVDTSWAISVMERCPELEFDRVWFFPIDTVVHVPVGREEAWAGTLQGHPAVKEARQAVWCPD